MSRRIWAALDGVAAAAAAPDNSYRRTLGCRRLHGELTRRRVVAPSSARKVLKDAGIDPCLRHFRRTTRRDTTDPRRHDSHRAHYRRCSGTRSVSTMLYGDHLMPNTERYRGSAELAPWGRSDSAAREIDGEVDGIDGGEDQDPRVPAA
jgi:hypothetical protein